ncbi:MAG: amidohydrolase [Pontimonas sp.]
MILRRAALLGRPESERVDMLLERGVIAAIEYAGHLAGSEEHEEIDLDGRVVAPGLWDEHVHLGMWAEYRRRIDLTAATSPDEAARSMAARQDAISDPIVIGAGYRDGLWNVPKSRALLDHYSGSRPWVLWSIDIHSCWVNSAAIELLGLDAADQDGVLRENDAFALAGRLSDVPEATRDAWVDEAIGEASTRGVVGVVDLDLDDTHANWTRRRAGVSDFPIRVEAGVYPPYFDGAIARGDHTGAPIAPGVSVGPLKVITDGSLNTRTAFCYEPYVGMDSDNRGSMNFETDYLEGLLKKAKEHGFMAAFHAIGDEANDIIIGLFESLELSGRIEHAQLLRPDAFGRLAKAGLVASVQPQHAIDDRDVADKYWADRSGRVIALRSMLDHGVSLAFGSDAPVSALHPLHQIAAAVTRTDDGRGPWHQEQRISVAEAFDASTRTTVSVGQPADVVALGADPLWLERAMSHDPSGLSQALRALPVELTIVDGRVTHDLVR